MSALLPTVSAGGSLSHKRLQHRRNGIDVRWNGRLFRRDRRIGSDRVGGEGVMVMPVTQKPVRMFNTRHSDKSFHDRIKERAPDRLGMPIRACSKLAVAA